VRFPPSIPSRIFLIHFLPKVGRRFWISASYRVLEKVLDDFILSCYEYKKGINQMPVTIRLSRQGAKKNPQYLVVAVDSAKKRDGAYLENLGHYYPMMKESKDK